MSEFIIEEEDIVCLKPSPSQASAAGWVNIGVHAVRIELDLDGNLLVETYGRTFEHTPIAYLKVGKTEAESEGGTDPDVDAADGTYPLTVDAIDYTVVVSYFGSLIEVHDIKMQLVASGLHDNQDEALHASFFDHTGHIEDHDARQVDLYDKPWREVATWLCAVHPNV